MLLSAGLILGLWHYRIGIRALWMFAGNEPLSSWVTIAAGPLSTLPAHLLAMFRRLWGAAWLIAGGLLSLGTVATNELLQGGWVTAAGPYATVISLPMILLGVGLVWCERCRAARARPISCSSGRAYPLTWIAIVVIYSLLSAVVLVVADWPVFNRALEGRSFWVIAPLLGPLRLLAMAGLLGVPLYIAATVLVLGQLWIGLTSRVARRRALLGALAFWVLAGLLGLRSILDWR